jgi:hypothetical protein
VSFQTGSDSRLETRVRQAAGAKTEFTRNKTDLFDKNRAIRLRHRFSQGAFIASRPVLIAGTADS